MYIREGETTKPSNTNLVFIQNDLDFGVSTSFYCGPYDSPNDRYLQLTPC